MNKNGHESRKEEVALTVVGDVCLGLEVRESIAQHGAHFPFERVFEELPSPGIKFGNLEFVFPGDSDEAAKGSSQLWAHDHPINGLPEAQFDVMSVANNHI